jgi:hypothetical protein
MNSTTFVLFGKYCPIMDQLGSKDSSRDFQLNYVISYFLSIFNTPYKRLKIDVMEREWKNLELWGKLNKAWVSRFQPLNRCALLGRLVQMRPLRFTIQKEKKRSHHPYSKLKSDHMMDHVKNSERFKASSWSNDMFGANEHELLVAFSKDHSYYTLCQKRWRRSHQRYVEMWCVACRRWKCSRSASTRIMLPIATFQDVTRFLRHRFPTCCHKSLFCIGFEKVYFVAWLVRMFWPNSKQQSTYSVDI